MANLHLPDGDVYNGELKDGLPNGKGEVIRLQCPRVLSIYDPRPLPRPRPGPASALSKQKGLGHTNNLRRMTLLWCGALPNARRVHMGRWVGVQWGVVRGH
jgi:hypothetical protein